MGALPQIRHLGVVHTARKAAVGVRAALLGRSAARQSRSSCAHGRVVCPGAPHSFAGEVVDVVNLLLALCRGLRWLAAGRHCWCCCACWRRAWCGCWGCCCSAHAATNSPVRLSQAVLPALGQLHGLLPLDLPPAATANVASARQSQPCSLDRLIGYRPIRSVLSLFCVQHCCVC